MAALFKFITIKIIIIPTDSMSQFSNGKAWRSSNRSTTLHRMGDALNGGQLQSVSPFVPDEPLENGQRSSEVGRSIQQIQEINSQYAYLFSHLMTGCELLKYCPRENSQQNKENRMGSQQRTQLRCIKLIDTNNRILDTVKRLREAQEICLQFQQYTSDLSPQQLLHLFIDLGQQSKANESEHKRQLRGNRQRQSSASAQTRTIEEGISILQSKYKKLQKQLSKEMQQERQYTQKCLQEKQLMRQESHQAAKMSEINRELEIEIANETGKRERQARRHARKSKKNIHNPFQRQTGAGQ